MGGRCDADGRKMEGNEREMGERLRTWEEDGRKMGERLKTWVKNGNKTR